MLFYEAYGVFVCNVCIGLDIVYKQNKTRSYSSKHLKNGWLHTKVQISGFLLKTSENVTGSEISLHRATCSSRSLTNRKTQCQPSPEMGPLASLIKKTLQGYVMEGPRIFERQEAEDTAPRPELKRGERENFFPQPVINGFVVSHLSLLCVAGHRKPWRGILIPACSFKLIMWVRRLQRTMALPAVTVGLAQFSFSLPQGSESWKGSYLFGLKPNLPKIQTDVLT